jgi:hypothetical protein
MFALCPVVTEQTFIDFLRLSFLYTFLAPMIRNSRFLNRFLKFEKSISGLTCSRCAYIGETQLKNNIKEVIYPDIKEAKVKKNLLMLFSLTKYVKFLDDHALHKAGLPQSFNTSVPQNHGS